MTSPFRPHCCKIRADHLVDGLVECHTMMPTEFIMRLARIPDQKIDLGRAEVSSINLDKHVAGLLTGCLSRPIGYAQLLLGILVKNALAPLGRKRPPSRSAIVTLHPFYTKTRRR